MNAANFPAAALDLILEAEGLDQPHAWPGGDSGITIGRGDDLGYQSAAEYGEHWEAVLEHDVYVRLLDAIGLKGEHAHQIAHQFVGIVITREDADAVFLGKTLPQYITATARTFPGMDRLPVDAQGALVSLVYNRGSSMGEQGQPSWDQRREMRAIRDEVAKDQPDLDAIAAAIRSMKRLWVGKNENGLLTRRDAEAALVQNAQSEVTTAEA